MADRRRKKATHEQLGVPMARWFAPTMEALDGNTTLISLIAKLVPISRPTLRANRPMSKSQLAYFKARVRKLMDSTLVDADGQTRARAERFRDLPIDPMFSPMFGRDSDDVHEFCTALDCISTGVSRGKLDVTEAASMLVELGKVGARSDAPVPLISPQHAALDAMLMALARQDIALISEFRKGREAVRSQFLVMAPVLDGQEVKRHPYARLLDGLYGLRKLVTDQAPPSALPSIAQLDVELGTIRGSSSPTAKWRGGHKVLTRDDMDPILGRLKYENVRWFAKWMHFAATFWHVLLRDDPTQVEWAIDRYAAWWALFRPPELVDGPRSATYFDLI